MPLALPVEREHPPICLFRHEEFVRGNRVWETPGNWMDAAGWISGELRLERS
ncbi:MAG: hypothetical protein OEM03_00165 [Chromatiales bacterium]|nr:hypothetical protein [Chromatiales bacterium]